MNDEQVGEQPSKPDVATEPKWGDPISADRQAELQGCLDSWRAETDHVKRKGPFDYIVSSDKDTEYIVPSGEERERLHLTGADVYWLAEQSESDEYGYLPNLHLETLYVNIPLEAGRDIQRSTGVGRLEA